MKHETEFELQCYIYLSSYGSYLLKFILFWC